RQVSDQRIVPAMGITRPSTRQEEVLVPPDRHKENLVERRNPKPVGGNGAMEFLVEKVGQNKGHRELFRLVKNLSGPF
ncbi:hypothetical protein MKK65_00015, partial [Methylobacterium sp. J-001]|nr:hypothetical protein [Methylobacterium sp. J-001]